MAYREVKLIRRRLANAYLSAVISISLVLLLVGIASMLLVNASSVSRFFKENMQVSVLMKSNVSEDQALAYQSELDGKDFINSTRFVSKEQGEEELSSMLGEDFLSVFEASPIPVSIDVTLKAEYVSPDSLAAVEKELYKSPLVDEVAYQQSLIEALNANLRKISLILGVVIILLLFISFVLINNTVRLSVFSRRFTIHTMKLVGATRSFIRSPFMVQSAFQGLFASIFAIFILLGLMFVVRKEFTQLFEIFQLKLLLLVLGIMVVSGVIICMVSTYFVVNRLVSLGKNELYY